MFDPLTLGMDQEPGAFFTMGLGILYKIKEKIKKRIEVIKRYIPKERRPVTFKIKMLGDLVKPITRTTEVRGNPSITQFLIIPGLGDLQTPTASKFKVKGSPAFPALLQAGIIGNPSYQITHTTKVVGSPIHKWKQRLSIEGERDLKKRIWTILEDEE